MMDESAIEVSTASAAGKVVNPILKKEKDTHHQHPSPAKKSSVDGDYDENTSGREKKHLKWDEHAIQEHDLLRGTRMKVRSVFSWLQSRRQKCFCWDSLLIYMFIIRNGVFLGNVNCMEAGYMKHHILI